MAFDVFFECASLYSFREFFCLTYYLSVYRVPREKWLMTMMAVWSEIGQGIFLVDQFVDVIECLLLGPAHTLQCLHKHHTLHTLISNYLFMRIKHVCESLKCIGKTCAFRVGCRQFGYLSK